MREHALDLHALGHRAEHRHLLAAPWAQERFVAGVCFSPDGRAVFVNVLREGLTVVITGPFRG